MLFGLPPPTITINTHTVRCWVMRSARPCCARPSRGANDEHGEEAHVPRTSRPAADAASADGKHRAKSGVITTRPGSEQAGQVQPNTP